MNRAEGEQLDAYNARPFQKLEGSRQSLFEQLDRPALKLLPSGRYELARWKKAKVNMDYHVEVDKHRYSVPYQLVHKTVEARITQSTVELFFAGKRIAAHVRIPHPGRFTTLKEHVPKSRREHADWTPERLVRWARESGGHTEKLVEAILASHSHPQQGFRACLGILRLGKEYGAARLEAACKRALALHCLAYKSIESILKHGLDKQPLPEPTPQLPVTEHSYVRGAEYYKSIN